MNIRVVNLTKRFGNTIVFDNFNTEFKAKQINCIMGKSGCGKTTLINMIIGITDFDSGQILGIDNQKFSVVFQEDRLCEKFNSIKNIRLVCNKTITDEKIKRHLFTAGLKNIYSPVYQLSGGMKRIVAIVRSIIYNADIIIMDEPFKGLDINTKTNIIKYIKDNTKGKTLLIITHNVDEINQLDSKNIILLDSKV